MIINLQGRKATAAISNPDLAARQKFIAAAKVTINKAARLIGQTAVQLHGGIALTEEYSAGHYFKRLTAIERLFGDVEHHLQCFITSSAPAQPPCGAPPLT